MTNGRSVGSRALDDEGARRQLGRRVDRVRGTAHFDVEEGEARRLVAALSGTLSGYLVPRLVREVPGAASKVPVA
jgi:hypothetical protein